MKINIHFLDLDKMLILILFYILIDLCDGPTQP